MDLTDKLEEASDAFHSAFNAALNKGNHGREHAIDDGLYDHMPVLSIAIELTKHLSEHKYEALTKRRAFEPTLGLAQSVLRRYVMVQKRIQDQVEASGYALEQCSRVLDTSLKLLQKC